MKKLTFYTHGGYFHADEVTAFAILRLAGVCDDFVRLQSLDNIPQDGIIADIGRDWNPEENKFDHNQGLYRRATGLPGSELDGVPLASAGMVWMHYGSRAVGMQITDSRFITSTHEKIASRVDETLIQGIDAHDADSEYKVSAACSAGKVRPLTISHVIAGMNGDDISNADEQDVRFRQAANLMQSILENHIRQAAKHIEAVERFEDVASIDYDPNYEGQVIILSEQLPWKEIIHEQHEDTLFVIAPSSHPGSKFSMVAVPVEPDSREVKFQIHRPEWFDGFIHQGKWIAGGNSVEELRQLAWFNITLYNTH